MDDRSALSGLALPRRALLPLVTLGALAASVGVGRASAAPLTSNSTGTDGGFFYSFWSNGGGSASMDLGSGGSYSMSWNGGNVVGGKGWRSGGARTVGYSASVQASGTAFLALYGWTKNPLVEYYIVEAWAGGRPTGNRTPHGSVGNYDIFESTQNSKPSIQGTATFRQVWSVRRSPSYNGSIAVGEHFDAWSKAGLQLGGHDYMIMATEGYGGSGKSSVSVS